MGYTALTAFFEKDLLLPKGMVVTAVLKGGCPLDCPFCIVKQRDERRETSYITTEHLTGLLASIDSYGFFGGAAIVGDEPLQDHCWPTAKAFLSYAIERNRPTALVSNGYNLIDFVSALRQLRDTKILVSLDAASEKHDEIRRKPGAFARISQGLRLAAEDPDLRQRLSIATIMMPGNLETIREIIAFTAATKIPQLYLSPLLTSSRTDPLMVHPKVMAEAWRAIPRLLDEAAGAGVKLRLSDEFAMLGPWEEKLAATGIEIVAPKTPARLIRVDAAGRVETLASMQAGMTTGLSLPADLGEMDLFAGHLIDRCVSPVSVAA